MAYILDTLSALPPYAYSLRTLTSTYSGPLITVTRTSDGTSQSFSAVNGAVDPAAIAAFVGTGTGTVTTWYNQGSAGSAGNLAQSGTGYYPAIAQDGTVYTLPNGTPALGFPSSENSGLVSGTTFSAFTNSPTSANIVFRQTGTNTYASLVGNDTEKAGGLDLYTQIPAAGGHGWYVTDFPGASAITLGTLSILSATAPSASSGTLDATGYLNSASIGTASYAGITTTDASTFSVAQSLSTTDCFVGYIPEVVVWSSIAPRADMAALEASQGAYYGVAGYLAPGAATVAITGLAPTVSTSGTPTSLTPGAGALSIAGKAPAVSFGVAVRPGAGAVAVTGYAPAVASTGALSPPAGQVVITGRAPAAACGVAVAPGVGVVAVAGYAPTIPTSVNLSPGAGALAFAGYSPSFTLTTPQILDLLSALPPYAYSLRSLTGTYSGPLITVTRASDSATQTFSAVNGAVSTAAIAAFCAGTTGTVTTWHNQGSAGSAGDLSSSTPGSFPQITDSSGNVLTQNGLPALYWPGTPNSGFLSGTTFGFGLVATSANLVMAQTNQTIGSGGYSVLIGNGADYTGAVKYYTSGNTLITHSTNVTGGTFTGDAAIPLGAPIVLTVSSAAPVSNTLTISGWINSQSIGTNTQQGVYSAENTFVIGLDTNGIGYVFEGTITEAVIWPSVVSDSDRATLESNQGSYYGVAGYPIIPGAGSITIAGHAPALSLGIAASPGAITLAGRAPVVTTGLPQILDELSVFPAVALSCARLLTNTYQGPLINVRRSSDNTTLDIYPVNGALNTAALLNFIGTGNGYVAAVYNQGSAGAAANAVQATAAKQPEIVNAGGLVTINTQPSMLFGSAAGQALAGSGFAAFNGPLSLCAVIETTSPTSTQTILANNGAALAAAEILIYASHLAQDTAGGASPTSWTSATVPSDQLSVVAYTQSSLFTGNAWLNGTALGSQTYSTPGTQGSGFIVGNNIDADRPMVGNVSEVVMFGAVLGSNDLVTLQNNQQSVYGSYQNFAPGAGSVLFTGNAPALVTGFDLTPGAGELAFDGVAPSLTIGQTVTAGTGAVSFTGAAPSVAAGLGPATGQVLIAGAAPAIHFGQNFVPAGGRLVFTGYAPDGNFQQVFFPGTGAVTVTGKAPTLGLGFVPGVGRVVFGGLAPVPGVAWVPGTGSVAVTGHAPSMFFNQVIMPPTGAAIINGLSPHIDYETIIIPAPGQIGFLGGFPFVILSTLPASLALGTGSTGFSIPSTPTAFTIPTGAAGEEP